MGLFKSKHGGESIFGKLVEKVAPLLNVIAPGVGTGIAAGVHQLATSPGGSLEKTVSKNLDNTMPVSPPLSTSVPLKDPKIIMIIGVVVMAVLYFIFKKK